MFCYYNILKAAPNLWTELPRYISYILGYSKTTGRTYFRGRGSASLFSTFDGVLIELTPESELPGDIYPSSVVPGLARPDVTVAISGTTLTGDALLLKF
jgi:hypothetical protein